MHRAVLAAGALAALLAVGALAAVPPLASLADAPVDLGSLAWPAAAGFAVLLFALQQQGFVFHWRERSTKVSLDEIGLFLGLLVLPPATVALATLAGTALAQLVHQRERSKAAFNVAQYTLAALVAGALVALARGVGVPLPWAAIVAPLVFATLTATLVSLLFAAMDGGSPMRVLRQRFGGFVLVGSALGVSLGLVGYALFLLHPLAVVAAVPIFLYLRRFGRLSEWADDELTTHRLVATVSAEVAGDADLDRVARRILSTCHELFDCGEASLVLSQGAAAPPRIWRESFGASAGSGGVNADVIGPDRSRVGTLSVFPKPGQAHYDERELQLLRTVAAFAAAAGANADTLGAARAANRLLAESEERYRDLFERAHGLIHVLDEEGHVLDANPAAETTLRWSAARRALPFEQLLCDGGARIVERIRAEGEVFGLETELRTADHERVPVLLDARALSGEPRRYVVFARDVTAQKKLEAELRLAMARQRETIKRLENMNRELEEFTLWTTHDMREPLRSIGTIAGFLHDDIGTIEVEEARDLARRISDGADRLKERVKALHAFSLIVQSDDEFGDVDMQRVVQDVLASLETQTTERHASIVLPSARFPVVRAQPHRIDQVVANLVENALKYGRSEAPVVEIGHAEADGEWRLFVRDNGPGIPPGYRERIFQLFQRGPETKEPGSGAGLAIVKRIAEQHGGRAWVESRPGQGACFWVALPKPRLAAQAAVVTLAAAGADGGRKRF